MDYGKLKTYYESIDGVTVPFVYPQYWDKDKEEWVVVDKDNRLPVDARLTGSFIELWKERDITASAGSSVNLGYKTVDSKYLSFSGYAMRARSGDDDFRLEVLFANNNSTSLSTVKIFSYERSGNSAVIESLNRISERMSVRVVNLSQEDRGYDVSIFGRVY